jgi:glycosyltransferase involved in cell wall biosynthesis
VLPGRPTEHEAELRTLAERMGVADRVRFLGWVSGEELESLYASATCFVLPSLIEGFGLPVLEAMARGIPVACSDRPALPEVVGDAAVLFDPTNQRAVTDAVRRLVTDAELRQTLSARGLERARQFTWRRTAEETLASYRRAIGE